MYFRNYAVEDIRLIANVRNAYRILGESRDSGHYETHHPFTGHIDAIKDIGFGVTRDSVTRDNLSYHLKAVTAGFSYSVLLLKKAREKTLERFPDYLNHSWVADAKGQPALKFHSLHRVEAMQFFSDQILELTKDPACFTTESCIISYDKLDKQKRTVNLIIDKPEITDEQVNEIMEHFGSKETAFPVSPAPLRFSPETVNQYITPLTHEMIELLNGKDSILPLSEIDKQLISAVEQLDIDTTKELLRAGANVNCIGFSGGTPLESVISVHALEFFSNSEPAERSESLDTSLPEWKDKQLSLVGELLKSGADPDLYGYDGVGPLQAAVYAASPEIVELLLQCGANPNYCPYAEDSPWIVSQPLDTAMTDSTLSETDDAKERYEKIILLLSRHGAKVSADDDGLLYPQQPPYRLDSLEIDMMETATDKQAFFLACQLAAGLNQHKPGIFAAFFADDILYKEATSGTSKAGLLTVIRHFEELIAFMRFNFMANHQLFEVALLNPHNEPVLIKHGLSKTSPDGIGCPVGWLKLEINKEGKIQKIYERPPGEEAEVVTESLFPGFSVVEFVELRKNVSGKIPPTQDVLINVYGSGGLFFSDMLHASEYLQNAYPCIQSQVVSDNDAVKTEFYDIRKYPSLDILYKGRLMRRFEASFSSSEIIEGARQLFETGFKEYAGQEGHGDHWNTLGDASQLVENFVSQVISQGEVESVDSLHRPWQEMTLPTDKTVCSIFHSPEPLGLKVILLERDDIEKSYQLVTAFPAARKGVTLPFTIREIQPWENLMEGVLVGQLDDGDDPASFGEGAEIGFFDTCFGQHYWRYRSGERLLFSLAGLVMRVEKIGELTFKIDNQVSLKRKYDLLGEQPELDADGQIKPDVYNMDGMKALLSGSNGYPEDCSFQMKISSLSVFELENIAVIEVTGPLFPTGPVEEGVLYIPQPVLPSGLVLSVGDNIRGIAWLHGRLVTENSDSDN